mmetsp:Transcript_18249/g.51516  ORF Transcript_18249/g.51516 Transcript_18249/m.51516 type:complete len:423 (+) Transcript_18249:55-1323(+)
MRWNFLLVCTIGLILVRFGSGVLTKVLPLTNALVVVADYGVLRADFPNCLGSRSNDEIDDWLLKEAAFFRRSQIELGPKAGVHGEVPVRTGEEYERVAEVPTFYGRGFVMAAASCHNVHLDVKGGGTTTPGLTPHSNGVIDVTGALYEYWGEKIVRRVRVPEDEKLASKDGFLKTVPTYAVISVGISLQNASATGMPWLSAEWSELALIVRRAHKRQVAYIMPVKESFYIEQLLLPYGATFSVGVEYYNDKVFKPQDCQGMPEEWSLMDIQGTTAFEIVDFSALSFRPCPSLSGSILPNSAVGSLSSIVKKFPNMIVCFDPSTELMLQTCETCTKLFRYLHRFHVPRERDTSTCAEKSIITSITGRDDVVVNTNGVAKLIESSLVNHVHQRKLLYNPISENIKLVRQLDADLSNFLDSYFSL